MGCYTGCHKAMKKAVALVILFAACLFAADFWSKPFSEWSDKDAHRMVENSPWAKPFSIVNSLPSNGGGRRGGGGAMTNDSPIADSSQASGSGMGRVRGDSGNNSDELHALSSTVIVRWQNSLPVKEALLRLKYGSEAATSPQAKQVMENSEDTYVVGVVGIAGTVLQGSVPVELKRNLIQYSFLSAKGKEDRHPVDILFGQPAQLVDVYFVFPRGTQYTLDDKDIDFTAQFGRIVIKQRFKTKDMTIDGKLAL
jgi:hypothetical protein